MSAREDIARIIYGTYLPANLWPHITDTSREKYLEAADALLSAGYAKATEPEWMTLQEAADAFMCNPKTIRRWIAAGHVEAKRIGPRLIRVSVDSMNALGRNVTKGYDE